jgi:hypothetical protein
MRSSPATTCPSNAAVAGRTTASTASCAAMGTSTQQATAPSGSAEFRRAAGNRPWAYARLRKAWNDGARTPAWPTSSRR